ncbi:aldo/keto reductase [Evansella sp. AB-P1]|uniref:aldo/keto reductase n=1 Tax=Evansella sp. AB-P1 TaxID=3037653 RepID=UPI00241C4153|nr:aldo/keto reductase [Evansella sp. AB-P1]MDG5789902.1 aldo/keto reductase [Evansella sp. AB-P1]
MERRQFGSTDMKVSVLGFGAAQIGKYKAPVEVVEQLLGSALDAGLNVIDTAECYGISEELIGRTVGHRRQDYYLFTKCGHAEGLADLPDWDPGLVEPSIDRSLKRLKTDYVDVVHLHNTPEKLLRQGDLIEELQRMKDKGKTRYIGYSGDSQAALYAIECGVFDSLETSLNIADQESIDLTLPEAAKGGMGVVIKRPIANAAWYIGKQPGGKIHQPYWDRFNQLRYDFLQGDDVMGQVSIALRFTLSVPGVCTAIVGTRKADRWLQNAEILKDGPLEVEQIQAIRDHWKAVARADWIGVE